MHPNQASLEKFYAAFAQLDADTMASCYALEAQFDDAAFSLRGHRDVTGMWRMLCAATQAKGLDVWKLPTSGIHADAAGGHAYWEADYRFSATGRLVHNQIDGVFKFDAQARITRHGGTSTSGHDRVRHWARLACCWAGHRGCSAPFARRRLPICSGF